MQNLEEKYSEQKNEKKNLAKIRDTLKQFLEQPADPAVLSVFRMCLGFTLLLQSLVSFDLIPLLWYGHSTLSPEFMYYGHTVWAILALMFLVGFGGRLVTILNAVVALTIYNNENTGLNMEETLITIALVWACAIPLTTHFALDNVLRRRFKWWPRQSKPTAWPILCMAANLGMAFLITGIRKCWDPVWVEGYGFYYTLLLPWFKHKYMSVLADSRAFVIFMNHGALFLEIAFLPHFFLRRTRWMPLLMTIFFFFIVATVAQMGFIGWAGLCNTIAFLSITPGVVAKLRRATDGIGERFGQWIKSSVALRRPRKPKAEATQPVVIYVRNSFLAILALIFIILTIDTFVDVTAAGYPIAHPPMRLATVSELDSSVVQLAPENEYSNAFMLFSVVPSPLRWVTEKVFKLGSWMAVFNHSHFFGYFGFRLLVTMDDGTLVEPFSVFNADLSPGKDTAGLSPRWLQAVMYSMRALVYEIVEKRSKSGSVESSNTAVSRHLLDTISFLALSRIESDVRYLARKITVIVSPIEMPVSYAGDKRLWLNHPWTPIYSRDLTNGSTTFLEMPQILDQRISIPSAGSGVFLVMDPKYLDHVSEGDTTIEEISTHP